MLRNSITIAWRRFRRDKLHSLLNLLGLGAGFLFTLLIVVFIWSEYQVNTNLKNQDRQYILQSHYKQDGLGIPLTSLGALAKTAHEEYPQLVSNYYRFDGLKCIVSLESQAFEENAALGDPTLFEMYGFEFHEGDPGTALNAPFTVVIAEDVAIKFFGKVQVVGEMLSIRNFSGEKKDFMITGVLKKQQNNSIINLLSDDGNTIFLPLESQEYFGRHLDTWHNPYIASYIELAEGATVPQVTEALANLIEKHATPQVAEALTPILNPLKDYYLQTGENPVGQRLNFLAIIATFVLSLAVINYISIAISQSLGRLKEVGMRRITGSTKTQLIASLLLESLLLVWISALLALAIYPLMTGVYTSVFGKELLSLLSLPLIFFIIYFAGASLVGILSGIYPAYKLSKTPVTHAVKSGFDSISEKQLIRKMLVTAQFTISIGLFLAALVVYKQTDIFFGRQIGYNKDHLLTVQVPRDWSEEGLEKMQRIQRLIGQIPDVKNISLSYEIPSIGGAMMLSGQTTEDQPPIYSYAITVDNYFAETYEIPLLAGNFFTPDPQANTFENSLVINNKAAEALGFADAESAIGQTIRVNEGAAFTLTGVTDDFVMQSMHQQITPLFYMNMGKNSGYRYFSIRLNGHDVPKSLQALENTWKTLMPDAPFAYTFMDDLLKKNYGSELQMKFALGLSSGLAVLMVLIGQFGLLSLSLRQRIKEIGIRKVLGASFKDLLHVFGRQYLWIFAVATLIAVPTTYYILIRWIENYHFRINLHDVSLLLPIGGLAGLAMTLVGLLVYCATTVNPVESLRDE